MLTSNEKYEREIFDSYRGDDEQLQVLNQESIAETDLNYAIAYTNLLTDVRCRNVSYKDIAEITISTLSDLELYELTAILNKHQKEKYELGN